ncbi:MAG: glutamate-5-semialdehyde dehydrogenase [Desulfovibrionaceae bacterium]|uniref:glutamate-5-semialdehyde dehydrogenase n=1 Tax=Desulfovibrio aminophilus TaxID=81425 RepID=UPI0004894AF0|nr:glutamate-5-semialdehyde dehydrogenase [Desulfovibrio aminophilus]MDY0304977.1 glutamate-5-semialdehyde dehydrogenase [Desulfovibrionaceae bacterium]
MEIRDAMLDVAARAKRAARSLASASGRARRKAVGDVAVLLEARKDAVTAANAKDVEAARAAGLDPAKLQRLTVTPKVLASMIQGCREVAALSDPVGEIESMWKRPNGMLVGRMRIPLGVVAMIYEARPNATVDAAVLCLMSGNACILRGGSEAFHSNAALCAIIQEALAGAGLPVEAVQVPETKDRQAVTELLKLNEYIDVVIPRGGESLIRAVAEQATMPVLKHFKGVCHIYVDRDADLDRAVEIVLNSKTQYPSACNALECLLVHQAVANELLPRVAGRLAPAGVRFKACPASLPLLGPSAEPAAEDDWGREYLDLVLAVRIVASMNEALEHIARFGSNHTEAILTNDHAKAMRFVREVDASLVLVNASTRFNDGNQLGLGAEIGISTSKLHAYGPMGLKELTSTKFVALGEGQVRE